MTLLFSNLCIVAGLFFLFYFVRITLYCEHIPDFGWFWSVGGILLFVAAFLAGRSFFTEEMILCFFIFGGLLMGVFFIVFGILSKSGAGQAEKGADYLILLGAGVNGTVPSKALMARIKAAASYLKENPGTKAILSGGQGYKEEVTEASAMEKELLSMNIPKKQLILEEKSTTTLENIAFSSAFIENKAKNIVIVTSDFHTIRGRRIAREAGFSHVETIGAPSSSVMKLHYYTRETLSWIKFGAGKLRQNGRKE